MCDRDTPQALLFDMPIFWDGYFTEEIKRDKQSPSAPDCSHGEQTSMRSDPEHSTAPDGLSEQLGATLWPEMKG